jgi:ubiquinone biosynthesis protein UbiJ
VSNAVVKTAADLSVSQNQVMPSSYELARQTAVDELDRLTEQKARLDKRVSKLQAAVQILDMMLEGNK